MLDEFYELRGWDKKSGMQTCESLEKVGLKDVADKLSREGLHRRQVIPLIPSLNESNDSTTSPRVEFFSPRAALITPLIVSAKGFTLCPRLPKNQLHAKKEVGIFGL